MIKILLLLVVLSTPALCVAQSWWGNFTSANDTYQDVTTGQSLSFRFTAPYSASVSAVAFAVMNAPVTETGTADLYPDDGSGYPALVPLASVAATLSANWNRIALPNVNLNAGVTYHLVYNVGGAGFRFKSGDLYNDRWIPASARVNDGWNWLYNPSGSWNLTMRDTPFILEFVDGRRYGYPYNDNSPTLNIGIGGTAPLMELHDNGTPADLLDDRCAGQVFRTPGNGGVCLARSFELKEAMFQAPNAPLQWTLEEATSGFDVASGQIAGTSALWFPVTFASPVTLWAQRDYRLWFKSANPPASPHILSCAWHAGTGAEWNDLTWQGTTGRAQSSTDGGANWTDHANGDLAFRMDIDTSPLPTGSDSPSLWMSANVLYPGRILTFRFETVAEGGTVLTVYNSAGEKLREVFRDFLPAGTIRDVTWDGKNEAGEPVATGLYMVHLSSPRGVITQLFVVVR